ncbi:MAG: endoribonuclease MazF [Limisphaerales bacterium]
MRRPVYLPAQGDLVWLDFTPHAGHEQGGRRPAVVVSPTTYNERIGLALVCPVTSQAKGYPFEVTLPEGAPIHGVVLADHIKSQDWRARKAVFAGRLEEPTLRAILTRARLLLTREEES